jgi:hypothetical protein
MSNQTLVNFPLCGAQASAWTAQMIDCYGTAAVGIFDVVREESAVLCRDRCDPFLPKTQPADPYLPALEDVVKLCWSGAGMLTTVATGRYREQEYGPRTDVGQYAVLVSALNCKDRDALLGRWCAIRNRLTGCVTTGQVVLVEDITVSVRITIDSTKVFPFDIVKCQF